MSAVRVQPDCLAPHTGWAWSMMGKATAVVTRYGWAASWHPWYRLPSIDSTGPAAASRSSADTCSEYLPWAPKGDPLDSVLRRHSTQCAWVLPEL